jgi:hypothetical protein
MRLTAQLYVGKRPISKGIGKPIRTFIVLAFSRPIFLGVSGEHLRNQTAPLWQPRSRDCHLARGTPQSKAARKEICASW